MTYVYIVGISVSAGLLAWALAKAVIDLRHWWENEMERWSDWAREWRQFIEQLQPLVYAFLTVLVVGGGSILFYRSR